MNQKIIIKSLELMRWIGVTLGFFLAFLLGQTPAQQFSIATIWVLISLHGLTGIESVFFGKAAAQASGYKDAGRYQKQSGINNLSVAIATIIVYVAGFGIQAKASLAIVMMLFFTMSGINHATSIFTDKNRHIKNILRPFMSLIIVAFMLVLLLRAVAV